MYNDTYISPNPLAVLKPIKEPRRYTLTEYLRKLENSDELYEYYDGIIAKLPMARLPHNQISTNFSTALNNVLEANGKDYRVLSGQQAVYLPALNTSVFPDILVVTDKPLVWDNNQVLLINPILIVEILSKGTGKYDRTEKFAKYKTLESLQEYVLVNQNFCYVESRFREEPNLWRDTIIKDVSSSIHLKSIGCTIDIQKIYKHIELKNK